MAVRMMAMVMVMVTVMVMETTVRLKGKTNEIYFQGLMLGKKFF
jgi:hypothetical protein